MRFLLGFLLVGLFISTQARIICLEPNKTDVWPPLQLSEYVQRYNFTIRTLDLKSTTSVLVVGSLTLSNPPVLEEHSVYNVSRYARGWTTVVESCDGALCFSYDRFLVEGSPARFRACYDITAYPYGKVVRIGYYLVLGAIISAGLIVGIISVVVCLLRRGRKSRGYRALEERPEDKESSLEE